MKKLFLILTSIVILVSCSDKTPRIEYSGITQGSYFSIIYYDDNGRHFDEDIDFYLKMVDKSVSLWNDSSIISRVNRNEDVTINKIFKDNFELAQKASELSDGAFDATIGPLVSAWGFHYKKELEMTPEMVDSIRQLVGYHKVKIINNKVVKDNPNMTLDFNAVAQGYTADLIAKMLDFKGVRSYLVDIGGEIMTKGTKPNGKMWTVGIEKPAENFDSEPSVQTKVEVRNKGVVTSGNYRKYIEKDGVRYSHSIDPKTGYPVEHNLLSATIIADNAAWADCLATICMIVGKEKASKLLENQDGVEAYFIFVEDGVIKTEWLNR